MKKLFKTILSTLSAILIASLSSVLPTFAADPFCDNPELTAEMRAQLGCGNGDQFQSVLTNILSAIIAIGGIVAVVFIVIGGVQYMTSTGDSAKVEKAKKTILYAVIGLIVCALAFAIVNWAIALINNA